MARRVLDAEAAAIQAVAARLDDRFDRAVEALATCRGRVVLLGMGKSGLVCRKIAATFSSTGTPALFVHPAEAFHGDLGGVVPGDVLILASTSGETEELVRLLPFLKQLGSSVVALTGTPSSSVGRAADIVLDVSVPAEACPLGLAPSASTTATLAMGDALAMAVAERRGFSAEEFGRLHPGGALGRRFLLVRDLMRTGADIPVVAPNARLRDVIHEMSSKGLGMTTVQADGRLLGVISDGDLRRHFEAHADPLSAEAAALMTRGPRTIAAEVPALRAIEVMEAAPRAVTWLIVTEPDGRAVGVLKLHDVLTARR
jgi:arabinose-5-phosphate isomerase